MSGSRNGQFKLADVPFSSDKAKQVPVPSSFERWKHILESGKHRFQCEIENLIQHAVDMLYSNRGQRWRRKCARRAVAIYLKTSDPTKSDRPILEAIARFVQFSLNWATQQAARPVSVA
jgi:hypothetical protein